MTFSKFTGAMALSSALALAACGGSNDVDADGDGEISIEEMRAEVDPSQTQFLAINLGEDEAKVRKYVEKTPFSYPVIMDPSSSLGSRYPLHGLPTMMVINKE